MYAGKQISYVVYDHTCTNHIVKYRGSMSPKPYTEQQAKVYRIKLKSE